MSSTIEETLAICEVKGAEIEASVWDKDKPISACFKAPQSLAPSPHIDTILPADWYMLMILALSRGFVRAYTFTKFKNMLH